MGGVQHCVGYEQLTSTSPGAFPVQVCSDVGRAAYAAVVLAHAATESHPTIARRLHQYQLIGVRTAGVEHFPLTVFHQR